MVFVILTCFLNYHAQSSSSMCAKKYPIKYGCNHFKKNGSTRRCCRSAFIGSPRRSDGRLKHLAKRVFSRFFHNSGKRVFLKEKKNHSIGTGILRVSSTGLYIEAGDSELMYMNGEPVGQKLVEIKKIEKQQRKSLIQCKCLHLKM